MSQNTNTAQPPQARKSPQVSPQRPPAHHHHQQVDVRNVFKEGKKLINGAVKHRVEFYDNY